MAKMGIKLTVIMVLGVFLAFSASAQVEWTRADLQGIYMEHLRQEGFLPSIDIDGDILFKVSGNSYFIIIDDNDLPFFQIYMGFTLGEISEEDALNAANFTNRRSKVAKTTISQDGRVASITVELLLNDPRGFSSVLNRSLSLIRHAENIFKSQLKEIEVQRELS
ncbi:MAG: hypothetical protein FWD28_07535 [Treponema sp.]|nr:hypothetical protein [Treponema sp.]